ncbi:MAG: pilus assembly protein [Herminiimonas sp.]|nr:pilus assembly protein [Herminiimonas sp.]
MMKNPSLNKSAMVNFSSSQRGASLLEGIAYLGIAALVVLGAVSLLTGAFNSAQSNRAAEEIVSIRTGVKKLYMGQANSYVAGDLTPQLITARVLPTTLPPNGLGTTLTNAWGGAVVVTGATANFTISYANVPQDGCIGMLSGASGWTNVNSNSVNVTVFPVTPAAAVTLCAAGANVITLTSA